MAVESVHSGHDGTVVSWREEGRGREGEEERGREGAEGRGGGGEREGGRGGGGEREMGQEEVCNYIFHTT